jgi:hypothetical protein
MIELIAARGNTSLESAVSLTKQIRVDIQDLGIRLSKAATDEELLRKGSSRARSRDQTDLEVRLIIGDMKRLIARIDDAVPLISLAITTSGVSLSTALPSTVSPSRLLQASTFLTAGDATYVANPDNTVQVGPVFVLSVYMLFAAHAYRPHDEEGVRETTWQEVIHKARVKLLRVALENLYDLPSSTGDPLGNSTDGKSPLTDSYFPIDVPSDGKACEFAYQLLIIEDLDDDRIHEEGEEESYEDVARAGIREIIPIHEISKIFYADTGKILNIGGDGETNSPILLLKRDPNAPPPRRMMERHVELEEDEEEFPTEAHIIPSSTVVLEEDSPNAQLRRESLGGLEPEEIHEKPQVSRKWRFPSNLDPEWIAFEVYTEAPESDEEDIEPSVEDSSPQVSRSQPSPTPPSSAFSRLNLRGSRASTPSPQSENNMSSQLSKVNPLESPAPNGPSSTAVTPALRTSLSLMELLIRLTALQQFQQQSHLTITDELLNFFLSESSTTGAGPDTEYRKKTRQDARRRVGFDPYDESPIKRRGEEYQHQYQWDDGQNYEHKSYPNSGAFDGEWQYGGGPRSRTPQSARNSPGLRSPPPNSSPSPSIRRGMQERSRTSPAGSVMRQPAFGGPKSPQLDTKGRPYVLRMASETKRSPLGRSGSDSTLGTSPTTVEEGTE